MPNTQQIMIGKSSVDKSKSHTVDNIVKGIGHTIVF